MRADPTDRIISADGPEISPVSVPRIFAVSLVLPFAHPIRLILASILPVALIAALGFGPIGRLIVAFQELGFGQQLIGASPTSAPAPPDLGDAFGADMLKLDGILFLALALWLCAWQRAVARGFAEPLLRWLGGSMMRFPGYIFALALWVLAPSLIMFIPIGALGWLAGRASPPNGATPQAALQNMQAMIGLFSDLQWWVIGAAMLVIMLIALWLSARLSPLPPLVASRGWRGAFGGTWQLSHGHGFSLALSLFCYSLLAFFVLVIVGGIVAAVMFSRAQSSIIDPGSGVIFGGIADLFVSALFALWHASLGGLVVRDGLSPAESLDPAMFD